MIIPNHYLSKSETILFIITCIILKKIKVPFFPDISVYSFFFTLYFGDDIYGASELNTITYWHISQKITNLNNINK